MRRLKVIESIEQMARYVTRISLFPQCSPPHAPHSIRGCTPSGISIRSSSSDFLCRAIWPPCTRRHRPFALRARLVQCERTALGLVIYHQHVYAMVTLMRVRVDMDAPGTSEFFHPIDPLYTHASMMNMSTLSYMHESQSVLYSGPR